jgi:hypothetical protein
VYAYLEEESITVTGIVVTCPTKRHTYYKIRLEDNTTLQASPEAVWNDNDAAYMASEFDPRNREDDPMAPAWISEGCGITLKTDDGYKRGTLTNDEDDGGWLLHVCQADVKEGDPTHYPVADLTATWRRRMMERILIPGWPADPATAEMSAWLQLSAASTDEVDDAERDGGVFNGRIHHARTATEATVSQPPLGTARIVSAKGLKSRIAPRNLREALALHNPDHPVWLGSMNTFTEITEEQMQQYKKQGCEVVPSMSIFTVKPDEKGEPYRAKARTVVLGNLERRTWTKEDKYAPVLGHLGARLLAAEATSKGRRLKHGDCKNAFCQPDLPDDEIVIVIPPKGCPYTKIGTYWKLNKTLYGLTCSPRHWFEKLTAALKEVGFVATAHDPCLWRTHPTDGTAPVFVGIYVDDFAYFSVDDAQERWFEREMNTRFKVDFMGDVNYFLGCRYDWIDEADGSLSVHISQEGFVDALLERYDMSDCRPASTPYRSGLPIDRVPRDANLTPHQREELRTQMQSILGSTTWLYTSTRPDLNVATSILSQYQCDPSPGHLEGARYILRYLKATKDFGISYHQNAANSRAPWPQSRHGISIHTYSDSNWGPQDASRPKENETRTVTEDECHSIQGYVIMRQHGPIAWGVRREKRISRSSCEAEIKAVDEATKATQYVRYIEQDLGINEHKGPTPLFNDNSGAVNWSNTGAISKKLRHVNIREFGVREGRRHGEIDILFIPGKQNPSDLFTKEHKSLDDFRSVHNPIVGPRPDGGCQEGTPGSGRDSVPISHD